MEAGTQLDTARADAKSKLDADAGAKDAVKAAAVITADETKKAAATSAREMASLMASLRKLETLKTRACAELAHAEKALAAADQAKAHAEDLRLKATAKAVEAGTRLDTARADAKSKLNCRRRRKERRQGGGDEEG